jgi:UDP-glucuronate 4-epimerase
MGNGDLSGRTALVTGAAGFIGFHLAHRLLDAGARVVGLDNFNPYYDVGLKEARCRALTARSWFALERLDLTDRSGVKALIANARPDVVIHLAAQAGVRYSFVNPHAYVSANVDGFLSVLEACRTHAVGHLIYASSSSVYGGNTKLPFHEDDPVIAPVSLYAATKRADELMAQAYAHNFGLPCSGLRFFTVYGPWGRPDMAYFSFTKAILEGRPIEVFNHGRMQRDFTYIDDAIEAVARLVDRPPTAAGPMLGMDLQAPHILYNVGNHTPVPLAELISAIEAATGREAEQHPVAMQPGDVRATYAEVERLARVTGFAPSTPLATGIGRFVAWYRSHYG